MCLRTSSQVFISVESTKGPSFQYDIELLDEFLTDDQFESVQFLEGYTCPILSFLTTIVG